MPRSRADAAAGVEAVAAALGADLDAADDARDRNRWMRGEDREATLHSMTGRGLLLGGAFHLQSGGEDGAPVYVARGRVATSGFDGAENGVRPDGEITTGFLSADVSAGR